MKGAGEYAAMFNTGQYGRLYIVSGRHARGTTFRIYILPDGEEALPNYNNSPLNTNAIEVYGVVSGHTGWTESYGWLYEGKWQDDFGKLCAEKVIQRELFIKQRAQDTLKREQQEKTRVELLLNSYK